MGGVVGARDHVSSQYRSPTRPRIELAREGPAVRIELEECGSDGQTGGAVRAETSGASAGCMSLASMR